MHDFLMGRIEQLTEFTPGNEVAVAKLEMRADARYAALQAKYDQAVRTLQDIAALGKKAGSEMAKHRLIMLGEYDDSGRQPVSATESQS